jgi:two-component system NarL family sensor kinase
MANPKLNELLAWQEAARTREHERISKYLHDETGSLLTGTAFQLEALRMDGVTGLEPALEALERAFESVRTLSRRLHPKVAERIGLKAALEGLAEAAQARFTGEIRCFVEEGASGPAALYDIAEEAVEAVIQRGNASRIEVRLSKARGLEVRDDGLGFTQTRVASRIDLLRLRYLCHQAGWRLRVNSGPGKGTIVQVSSQHAI